MTLVSVQSELIASGLIQPVGEAGDANRRWLACDTASAVEGCLADVLDPDVLSAEDSRLWHERLGRSFVKPRLHQDDDYARRYWLLDQGQRIGTICLDRGSGGSAWQRVSSLYTLPRERGKGTATRVLRALADAAVRHGLHGIRLGTSWTWQKSLRFYLARGFWIASWKHDKQLVLEPQLPEWRCDVEENQATFLVGQGGPILAARREGELLVLDEAADHPDVGHYAIGTFAVLLALHGWPLVRSVDHWAKRYRWSDAGEPEGLAYKIGVFERAARESGWIVSTPRIAGLTRWQTWAEGEEHGRREQLVRDIDAVLRARGIPLGDELLNELRTRNDTWNVEELLRTAANATSFGVWWASATR